MADLHLKPTWSPEKANTSTKSQPLLGVVDSAIAAPNLNAVEFGKPIPQVQQSAVDLYRRGLNVFPVCRPETVKALARISNHFHEGDKVPFTLKGLFYARMHLCDFRCMEREQRSGRSCAGKHPGVSFLELFDFANLAVMLGHTSGNLVDVDCDTQFAFRTMLKEFSARGLACWAYTSHRGGHLLFRLKDGEATNQENLPTYADVQIWGRQRFVVLPPSVHASGEYYRWLDCTEPVLHLPAYEPPPLLAIEQLAWLGLKLHRAPAVEKDLYGLPAWTSHLSDANRQILVGAWREGERNTQLVKPAYEIAACIENGIIDFKDGFDLLCQAAGRCIPPYPAKQVEEMLASAMRKRGLGLAREHHAGTSTRPAAGEWREVVDLAEEFLNGFNWRTLGRTQQTDRKVFAALIERARMDRSPIFRASQREVAELANLQKHRTAGKAIGRLRAAGLIQQDSSDGSGAYRYSFGSTVLVQNGPTIPPLKINGPFMTYQKVTRIRPESPEEQDVFQRLGQSAWLVWQQLRISPEPGPSAIARKAGMSPSSAGRGLQKLMALGLVVRSTAEGLYVYEDHSPDALQAIAVRLGAAENSAARARKFEIERELRVNKAISKARGRFRRMIAKVPNQWEQESTVCDMDHGSTPDEVKNGE